jgi:hypothetical protein
VPTTVRTKAPIVTTRIRESSNVDGWVNDPNRPR